MGQELLAAIALSVIAAAALALAARTLRQPLILGYIIGGVVLGRHLGLGLVSDEASIEVISEIGLIFLLFIIGLEIATFAGKLTLGVLIFQDLEAISFLALQPNLDHLGAGPLVRSLAAGAALVGMAAVLSRYVLPTLFRAIATSYELVLITAIAW